MIPHSALSTRTLVALFVTALSSAQSLNSPFIHPFTGDTVTAGTNYNITWSVIIGPLVSIQIKNTYTPIATFFNGSNCPGDLVNFRCSQIATDIQNLGVWQWSVPANAPSSGFYTLDLYVSNGGLSTTGTTHYTTGNFFISQPSSGGTGSGSYSSDTSSSSSTRTIVGTSATQRTSPTSSSGFIANASGTVSTIVSTPTDEITKHEAGKPGIGIIAGLAVGIVLVLIAVLALIIFFVRRKKGAVDPKPNLSASGRVREDAQSMDDKTEVDELSYKESLAEESRVGGRIRYLDPDDDLPSGRLQHG